MKKKLSLVCQYLSGSIALVLLAINSFGLTQDIRPAIIDNEHLRFKNDFPISFSQTLTDIERRANESPLEFTLRVNQVVSKSLAHIHWQRYRPDKFNQLVPVWENYILYLMGKLSGIPEYQKYHFANYKKSLERGIGICGDASMVLSQILDKHNIANNILSYKGHVVVEAHLEQSYILDPDFGVSLPYSKATLQAEPQLIQHYYNEQNYSPKEINTLARIYSTPNQTWHGVSHFITNKYYFEQIAYVLKWILPLLLLWLYFRLKKVRFK